MKIGDAVTIKCSEKIPKRLWGETGMIIGFENAQLGGEGPFLIVSAKNYAVACVKDELEVLK
ncbi:MAG: hypothetical protein M0R49_09105 [Limnochordia bacterium]|jgi:hypothetical protein|nr:hypothetical protein [Limnochordia bacterium]